MVRGQVRIWSGVRLGYGQGSGLDMVRGQVRICQFRFEFHSS